MTQLWPHLPEVVSAQVFQELISGSRPSPAARHSEQVYAPVGGRVPEPVVQQLIDDVTKLAVTYGYPNVISDAARIAFDRAAAPLLHARVDVAWAEAGNRGLWSFISLVALPHLTMWRFGLGNRERWVATDLTRHTWARLWWQAVVFADDHELLNALTESDLNQLLERRSIGGDPRLVRFLGRAVVEASRSGVPRRHVIRDVTLRLRRLLAFLDVRALDDIQIQEMCWGLTNETVSRYRADPRRL